MFAGHETKTSKRHAPYIHTVNNSRTSRLDFSYTFLQTAAVQQFQRHSLLIHGTRSTRKALTFGGDGDAGGSLVLAGCEDVDQPGVVCEVGGREVEFPAGGGERSLPGLSHVTPDDEATPVHEPRPPVGRDADGNVRGS